MEIRFVRLCDAAREGMASGDLLLYQADHSLISLLISRAGRTRYCHAGRAYRGIREWRTIDTCAWTGGRNISLAREVRRHPGQIDVFEPNPGHIAEALGYHYDPKQAVEWLQEHVVDCRYGWWSIALAALRHTLIVRWFVCPLSGENGGGPPYCSQAQAAADRFAGFDPVPHLADRLTEPGDLARSLFYKYRFTLVV